MRWTACLCMVVLGLVGCGDDEDETPPVGRSDPGVVHVHGLGRNPADGSLMIATHTGLFRVAGEAGQPTRVADRYQDTMGFTVVGPDHFLGSGHPGDLRKEPPFLGLIESRDAGATWRPLSLRGKVDFHVLEAVGRTVYGFGSDFDSREARFLRSEDGGRTWTRRSPPEPLLSLAIDPANRRHIVALGEERGYVSRDGGSRWRPLSVPGGLVTWTRQRGLVAIDLEGIVRRADQPSATWAQVGDIGGAPAAVEGVGEELLAARHDAAVLSSRDAGRNWRSLLGNHDLP